MSFLGKLAFWKKNDVGLEKIDKEALGLKTGVEETAMQPEYKPKQPMQPFTPENQISGNPLNQNYPGIQPTQQFTPNQSNQASQRGVFIEKDLEVISAKLDTLKIAIDNINQRLANIEMQLKNKW